MVKLTGILLLILILVIVGLIVWLIAGPSRRAQEQERIADALEVIAKKGDG